MGLVLITPPAEEPVSLAEAKLHLRVDVSDDDALINGLIQAARERAEDILRRALITQTWELTLDQFPSGDEIELPFPPLQSVASIKYTNSNGDESVFSSDDYIVDTAEEPGKVVLAYGSTWPSVTLYPTGAVAVRYVAGYGEAADVPQTFKQAMLLMAGEWYENRENATQPRQAEIPLAAKNLLWPRRVFGWP
jgi:uncharacterized phiE125 gp8 family phage protein